MFTPVDTSLGAFLLHQGSSGLLQHDGRIFGISSFLSGCVGSPGMNNIPIILGLVSSIAPVSYFAPSLLPRYPSSPGTWEAALITAGIGFLVGWGTKNDNGCTSGHMLCGLSRLSPRSIIATGIFFTTALITANSGYGAGIPPSPTGTPAYVPTYPTSHELGFMAAAVILSQLVNSYLVPRFRRSAYSSTFYSYLAGLEFGLGLLISGMASPAKVLGFFSWLNPATLDPSLALVMLFGVGPSIWSYYKMKRVYGNEQGKKPPTLAYRFQLPTARVSDIGWRFVLGAVSFGVGWGLCGVCPGPGLLRAVLQPAWGAAWLGGFWLGSLSGI